MDTATRSSVQLHAASRALTGLRVLDFSIMLAGPYGARLLADLGADVVKIEPPEGDDMRQRQPLRTDARGQAHSTYFGQLNAGKRSLALDLKQPEAVALVKQLAQQADVVVENYRPGVMQRLGLGAEVLRALNPRLIFCSISGYGQSGPNAERAAYAMLVQAESGFESTLARYAGHGGPPAPTATFVADLLGGIFAFSAIQAALVQRERTGEGQVIDVALMDCMVNLLVYEMQEAQCAVSAPRPVYGPVAASDGHVLVAPITVRNFEALAEVTQLSALREDPRFATLPSRSAHWNAMMAVVQGWTRTRTVADVVSVLEAAGVPCARYNEPVANLDDVSLRERGLLAQVRDTAGAFTGISAPWQMSGTASDIGALVPGLGEHREEVLRSWLGLEGPALERLRESAVFGR